MRLVYYSDMECLYHAICLKDDTCAQYGTAHPLQGYGVPGSLVVDNGKEFIGRDLEDTRMEDREVTAIFGRGVGRLLLMGRLDTVYPDGTAAARPMGFDGSKILGPDVYDMKSGLLTGMYATTCLTSQRL